MMKYITPHCLLTIEKQVWSFYGRPESVHFDVKSPDCSLLGGLCPWASHSFVLVQLTLSCARETWAQVTRLIPSLWTCPAGFPRNGPEHIKQFRWLLWGSCIYRARGRSPRPDNAVLLAKLRLSSTPNCVFCNRIATIHITLTPEFNRSLL